MQAVILAGGAGTRLYPLTLNVPKAMIVIEGKPFMLRIVEELKRYGIKDFVFCIGYLAEQFKDFFGDGSRFGIKIAYSVEKEFMGTGGAIKMAEAYLKNNFFVVNGDTYLPIDYLSLYKAFKKSHKRGMVVLYDNNEKITEANIAVNDKGIVTAYVKKEKLKRGNEEISLKKASTKSCQFIDAGVHIFEKTMLGLIAPQRFVTLEMDIFPKLIKQKELASHIVSQRYYDIGTPERLKLIRKVFKS
jgi:NDP-sugar pyrophosphorylase family protein